MQSKIPIRDHHILNMIYVPPAALEPAAVIRDDPAQVTELTSKGNLVAANNVPHQVAHSNAAGVHTALPLNFFIERYAQAYIDELKAFVQAVVEDTPPPVTGFDGRIPVVMGLAAGKSYQENRPVKLSEVGG